MSLTIELVVPCSSYRCGYLHIFQSFWIGNLRLTRLWDFISHFLRTMPFNDLMSSFLGLLDCTLILKALFCTYLMLESKFGFISTISA